MFTANELHVLLGGAIPPTIPKEALQDNTFLVIGSIISVVSIVIIVILIKKDSKRDGG